MGERRRNVYFGRVEDGVLESEFSGNLVEVCPTGVFTDKTHSERYNRKWDMHPSVELLRWRERPVLRVARLRDGVEAVLRDLRDPVQGTLRADRGGWRGRPPTAPVRSP